MTNKGEVKAFILNKMRFNDTLFQNEYDLRLLINKEFNLHLRPQEVRRFHIEKLIKKHWLKEVITENKEVGYIRIGSRREVNFYEPLKDQLEGIPSELQDSYLNYLENQEALSFYMTESEYIEYKKKQEEIDEKEYQMYMDYKRKQEEKVKIDLDELFNQEI